MSDSTSDTKTVSCFFFFSVFLSSQTSRQEITKEKPTLTMERTAAASNLRTTTHTNPLKSSRVFTKRNVRFWHCRSDNKDQKPLSPPDKVLELAFYERMKNIAYTMDSIIIIFYKLKN